MRKPDVIAKMQELWDSHLYDEASAIQEFLDWAGNQPDDDAPGRISLPLHDGRRLIAELNPDREYREIFVGIEDDGSYCQDLAVVRENYRWKENFGGISEYEPIPGQYEVLVYADAGTEDYTDRFLVHAAETDD